MASNLIPMLSSSPPPMDENGSFDDDDDDDFGDFTCAGGVKVLDSPLNSPVKSSAPSLSPPEEKSESECKKVTWSDNKHIDSDEDEPCEKPHCQPTEDGFLSKDEGTFSEKVVVFSEDVEEFNCDEDEMDFGEEKQGLSAKYAFTHSEQHDNTSQESVTDSGLCSSSQRSETSPLPPGEAMFPELSPETETEEPQEAFPEDSQPFYLKQDLELARHQSDDDLVADSFDDTTTPVNEPQSFDDSLHISQTLDDEDFQEFTASTTKVMGLNLEAQNIIEQPDMLDGEMFESVVRTDRSESEENDDFAEFECAQFSSTDRPAAAADDASVEPSFADFSLQNSGATEDSEWANFASSEIVPPHPLPSTSSSSGHHISHESSSYRTVQCLLESAFPKMSEDAPEQEQYLLPVQPILGSEASYSCLLWRRLEDLDGSVSLQYQWGGSHSFQKILQALNIDSRNVLRNSSVPLFALGLGELLEPVKLVQDEKPVLFTTITTTTMPTATEKAEEGIPPAQFDWKSSGLVNPLDPSQSNSTLLDLDFFTNIETSPGSTSSATGKPHAAKTSSLEEEFLGMDPMCAATTAAALGRMSQLAGEDLVQKLLLSVPSSSLMGTVGNTLGSTSGTPQLSAQATDLLSLLPDLTFMQAKVLMFPIRGTLDS